MNQPPGILHALYSLRAEGCPRLAYDLLDQEMKQTGRRGFVTLLDPQDDLRKDYDQLGIPVHQLIWKRKNYVSIYQQFLKVLQQWKPSGVVLYPLGAHISLSLACRKLKIPHVVHLACLPPWRDYSALQKLRVQMWTGQVTTAAYAACSERVRQDCIRAYRLPPTLVQTVYNGISLDRFDALRSQRQSWSRASGKPLIIGMTGSLELSKDHPTLLRAVSILKQQGQNIRLRLVGGGTQADALKQLASELQISDIVDWTGSVRDVLAELARFDVYAFSAKPEEGLGIALIEAMASGLPVLATDIPAVREIFKHHPHGIKVPFGDAQAMAAGILNAAQQPAAARDALSRFDIAQTFREYEDILASQRT